MSAERSSRAWIVVALLLWLSPLAAAAYAQGTPAATPSTHAALTLPDTLPPYGQIRGTSRDRKAVIAAVTDALEGRSGLPAPLVTKSYRRDGKDLVIDMVADSLPRVRFHGAGGTVRILEDGRRVIVARHN